MALIREIFAASLGRLQIEGFRPVPIHNLSEEDPNLTDDERAEQTIREAQALVNMPPVPPVPMTEGERSEVERLLGTTLPQTYRQYLLEIGAALFLGVRIQPIQSSRSDYGPVPVTILYGGKQNHSLQRKVGVFRGRIPQSLIPIGDGGFGNQLCIAIQGKNTGKVYLWDHEDERAEDDYHLEHGPDKPVPIEWLYGNLILVASSFDDFLSRLEPCD